MNLPNYKFEVIYGSQIKAHIDQVAKFRIKYFRDFPYLYEGDLNYERKYLDGYAQDPKSILIKMTDSSNRLLAISTALPLITPSDILEGSSELFQQAGYDPKKIYYYGEIILDYEVRGKGIARTIYDMQDEFARKNNFHQIAIATVLREASDTRQPTHYVSADHLWGKLDFQKTSINFEFSWPTILVGGEIKTVLHPMIYWIKTL